MKKIIFLLSSILAFTASSGCDLWQKNSPQNQKAEKISDDTSKISTENPAGQAAFSFDFGDGATKNFVLTIDGEKTVYDFLNALAGENQIKLEIKESSLGVLIQTIDAMENGQNNKYWLYYINGQMAPAGVAEQKVSPNDKIEFKFEANPF